VAKTVLRDTHMLLDARAWERLRDIASWSEETAGLSKTVRAITRKVHALLSRQIAAEAAGRAFYLVEVGADGVELMRERISFRL